MKKLMENLDETIWENVKKIDKENFDKIEKNPMGGINIYLTINDDSDMVLHTTLVKGTQGEKYKIGVIVISPKLSKFID